MTTKNSKKILHHHFHKTISQLVLRAISIALCYLLQFQLGLQSSSSRDVLSIYFGMSVMVNIPLLNVSSTYW